MDVNLTPINVIALAKSLRDEYVTDARECLTPGLYKVDATVRIKGDMSVAEDYDAHIVAKANPWTLLAMALNKLNGVTIKGLVRAAEELGEVAQKSGEIIKEQAAAAIAEIKDKTITPCKGRVSPRVVIEVVRDDSTFKRELDTKPRPRKGKTTEDEIAQAA